MMKVMPDVIPATPMPHNALPTSIDALFDPKQQQIKPLPNVSELVRSTMGKPLPFCIPQVVG
jgi:hypothetical protein